MILFFEHCERMIDFYNRTVNKVAMKHDITFMEFTVLMFLSNNPEYDTASEIVKYRHLSKSHVSMSLKTLLQKNMIEIIIDDIDHRVSHIKLLPNTKAITDEGRVAQKEFFEAVFKGFEEKDFEKLKQYIIQINNNIK